MSETKTYWASADGENIGKKIADKYAEYYKHISVDGHLDTWLNKARLVDAGFTHRATVGVTGKGNERRSVSVNWLTNRLDSIIVSATSDRITLAPRASNSDAKSLKECVVAKGLCDLYLKDAHLGYKVRRYSWIVLKSEFPIVNVHCFTSINYVFFNVMLIIVRV